MLYDTFLTKLWPRAVLEVSTVSE